MSALIIAACRTAVVPRGGAFADMSLHDLAAPVVRTLLGQSRLSEGDVDEVIVSNALGAGGNPARRVALASGLPEKVAGLSIDRQCAGGMDALLLARMMVESGSADIVIAGGVESYSRRPNRAHTFSDGRAPEPFEQAPFTPWPNRDPDMTVAAAELARRCGITRQEQDAWAIDSHAKARSAAHHSSEIVPLGGMEKDPFTRRLSVALCQRAQPLAGDITAANAAVAADGAAFCLVVAPRVARRLDAVHPVRIIGGATRGGVPDCPGLAPVVAINEVLRRHHLALQDLTVIEMMEAYAVQAIACLRETGLDPAKTNLGGGALARGHPIGASGAINVVRLFHTLRKQGGTGLAAIAAAGGIGTALLLQSD